MNCVKFQECLFSKIYTIAQRLSLIAAQNNDSIQNGINFGLPLKS